MSEPAHAAPSRYELSWNAVEFPDVRVTAELDVSNGAIGMSPHINVFFANPRGFAGYVRDLEIHTLDGRRIEAVPDDESGWRLQGFNTGRVRLRYRVDLDYAAEPFPSGNEQSALLSGRSLFATGYALFIVSAPDEPATVLIDAPDGWSVTTAWEGIGGGSYRASDQRALTRNAMAIGQDYYGETLERNGLELRIALLGVHSGAGETVRSVFLPVLDYYAALFRHDEGGHFMLTLLPGRNDGEAYTDSFASSQPQPPRLDDSLVWANSLAHEFFHFWLGSRITSDQDHYVERQWFTEGATEYYANRALLETGVIDQRTYDEILSQYLSMHLLFATNRAYEGVTIREAGQAKGTYRPGVYDSGVAAAFCIDSMIRDSSGSARSLDDMMRLLDARFGSTGRTIVFEDIVAAANETIGGDRSDFFARHIEAREPLPIGECAARMGYRTSVDGYHVLLRRTRR